MARKSTTAYLLICFLASLASSATITKLEGIEGTVTLIETDSYFYSYIVTYEKLSNTNNFYVLDTQDTIIFSQNFENIITLKFNTKNQLCVFNSPEENGMNIWIFDQTSATISNFYNYFSAMPDFPAFFDSDNNLIYDSLTGIKILRNNESDPISITKLSSYNIINNLTHAVDEQGNVYLGLSVPQSYDHQAVVLTREEIYKPDPTPYFYNFDSYGRIREMSLFNNNSIAFATSIELLILRDDYFYRFDCETPYCYASNYDYLYPTKTKLYYRYEGCTLKFLTQELEDIKLEYFSRCYVLQVFDKNGNAFIASSYPDFRVYSVWNNDTSLTPIKIPNSLSLHGLEVTENGCVWVLAQNLYLIPQGATEAVKVINLPFTEAYGPIRAKPGTDNVFIVLDDGLYIASQ